MAKCLVQQTSSADRQLLVQWIFSAMSEHPAVKALVNISEPQRTTMDKGVAKLFEQLLLSSCRIETEQAIRFEGPQTVRYAFEVLGRASTAELMQNPAVLAGVQKLNKYMDMEKLKSFTASATAPAGANVESTPSEGPKPAADSPHP